MHEGEPVETPNTGRLNSDPEYLTGDSNSVWCLETGMDRSGLVEPLISILDFELQGVFLARPINK